MKNTLKVVEITTRRANFKSTSIFYDMKNFFGGVVLKKHKIESCNILIARLNFVFVPITFSNNPKNRLI